MLKLLNIMNIASLGAAFIFGGGQQTTQGQRVAPRNRAVTTVSPGRRYAVRFSDERSDGNAAGKLWGTMSILDLQAGDERTARVAEGLRGSGVFEGFSRFESSQAWSPDGMYMAYWDGQCQDEPSVPGGVVCHLHEVHFLKMTTDSSCRENLVLSRYAFSGWARGQAHTVLEVLINEDGQKAQRLPCAKRKKDEVAQKVPVRDADQAIGLFQH